jgi:hypothetical protein
MGPRNYSREIRDQIDDALAEEDDFVAGVVAQKIVAKLRETDPELLHGWLDEGAEGFIREAISAQNRSARTYARMTARRSVFAEGVKDAETGDTRVLSTFMDTYYVVEGGSRKRLANMNRDDLTFAADRYEDTERRARMAGAFLKALANKVGDGVVRDSFTEEQLGNLWRSL